MWHYKFNNKIMGQKFSMENLKVGNLQNITERKDNSQIGAARACPHGQLDTAMEVSVMDSREGWKQRMIDQK